MLSQGTSEGRDVERQTAATRSDRRKSTEVGAPSKSVQSQTDFDSSEAETQVVRRSKGRSLSDRKVFETWILPIHRLPPLWGKKRRQSKLSAEEEDDEEHDYVNMIDRKKQDRTTEDVTPVYVNVATATNESGDVNGYENCEFASKDPRITTPQDPKPRRMETPSLSIPGNSLEAPRRIVTTVSLRCTSGETAIADSYCSDDESNLDSSYVDMSSKQMTERLQRLKL